MTWPLFLQVVLFQLLVHQHRNNTTDVSQLWHVINVALKGYLEGAGQGQPGVVESLSVDQVYSLITCKFMWM